MESIYNFFTILFLKILSWFGYSNEISYQGYIEGNLTYISSTTSGILKKIFVNNGDQIPKNTKLYELKTISLKSQIDQIKSKILQTKIKNNIAKKEYIRSAELFKKKAISYEEYEKKQSIYQEGIEKINELEYSLVSAKQNLAHARPESNYDALIHEVFYTEGEYVTAGTPIVSLFNPSQLVIRFFIPQNKLSSIQKGTKFQVRIDGSNKLYDAKITFISNILEYTPPMIYSINSRQKFSIMVEGVLEKKTDTLSLPLGCPVDIFFKNEKKK